MAEDAYNKKISDLQKHVPFLENMIAQLKDPKGKPREAQLTKLEAVHNMITDRNKKWKFETLLKCEDVITKLQTKVKANRASAAHDAANRTDRNAKISQTVSEIMNALKFNNARAKLNSEITTPKSPSPVREPPVKLPPKIIPTETTKPPPSFKIDPNDFNIASWKKEDALAEERYVNEKPDIYSSAAKSLISSSPAKKATTIFDRLGPVVHDTTKPLLSDADLESLRAGDDFLVACPNEDAKAKDKAPPDLNLTKTTPRIVPVPSSKPKSPKLECPKHHHHQADTLKAKPVTSPVKVEKLKDSDMFGNLLTSIDSKILEGNKRKEVKKKEHEKKPSGAKRKEKTTSSSKTEPAVVKEEKKIEVKLEVPSDKPVRLADKYNPKPKKHVDADIEKAVDDSIQKRMEKDPQISLKIDIFTKDRSFESRDPRRRLSILQETSPPQQQTGSHFVQAPSQRSIIEVPLMRDPRRPQSRFSPPPPQLAPFGQAQNFQNFVPGPQSRNVFNQPPNRLGNFHSVSPFQQNFFNQNFQTQSLRYDQNPPAVRFEPPPSAQQASSFVPKKSFNPFEPLDSGRDEKDPPEFFGSFNNQPLQSPPLFGTPDFQQRGNYPTSTGPRGGGKFNRPGQNYGQYTAAARQDRRFDSNRGGEYRRPPTSVSKEAAAPKFGREDEITRERPKKDEAYKSRTKYDEIYSKIEKDKETFTSPLESLYLDPKSSIKATIQSFKIPKKHKVEEAAAAPPELPPPHKTPELKEKKKVKPEPKPKKRPEKNDESGSDSTETLERKRSKKKVEVKKEPPSDGASSGSDVPLQIVKKKKKKKKQRSSSRRKPDDSDEEDARRSRKAKTAAKKRLIEDSDETELEEPPPPPKKDEEVMKDVKVIVEKNIDVTGKKIGKVEDEEVDDVAKPKEDEEAAAAAEQKIKSEALAAAKKSAKPKSDVDKAKELLTETKAGSLDIDDKELIEFVLQNFKKIRQLFKKDSSSDEEDEATAAAEAKKKKKAAVEVPKQEEEPELPPPLPPQEEPPPPTQYEPPPPPPPPQEPIRKKRGPKPRGKFKRGGAKFKPATPTLKNVEGRITRTRSATLLTAVPRRARRSELDKLHEDIKEMLMGGEVLTASNKRTCTIQKDEADDASEKATSVEDETSILTRLMDSSNVDPSKLKAKGANLRVLIEKTDLAKLLIKDELKKKEKKPSDDDDEVGEKPPEAVPKQQKIFRKKKRRFNWASGVIKKKKKGVLHKPPENTKDADEISLNHSGGDESAAESLGSCPEMSELIYVEPDKEYYPKYPKSQCKLCAFRGKFIVQHYKGAHPEHEVLIARMNPAFSEKAVAESADNNYDGVEAIEMLNEQNTRKKRFNYQCPFCLVKFMNENSEVFYDHLAGHTGEYRFPCPYCGFKTASGRNLRPHIMSTHNRSSENVVKATWPAPPNFKFVFGYLCAECHYVQLNKSAVEDHVKIYHLENQKIHRINMSAMPCEEIDDVEPEIPPPLQKPPDALEEVVVVNETDRHINESIERVIRAEDSVVYPVIRVRKKKVKKTAVPQVKQLKVFELISEITGALDKEPVVKTEPVELQKSPDLDAFMCNPDNTTVEELTVEENRLRKMKEIHEIVKPSRTSIVDRLQSRLDTTTEAPPGPPEEAAAAAAAVNKEVIVAKPPPPLVLIDRSSQQKKTIEVLVKNPPVTETLPQKNAAPISSIINRLQDKLVNEINKLPPLTHYRNLKTDNRPDMSLRIGPVQVMLNKTFILYACFVPTCVFCTDKQNIFETHCKVTHKDFICTFKEPGKCDVCNVKIDHDGDYITMHDTYVHIVTSHDDFLKKLAIKKDAQEAGPSSAPEKETTVSVEKEEIMPPPEKENASVPEKEIVPPPEKEKVPPAEKEKVLPESVVHELFKLPHDVPNLISQGDDENTGAKYPFVITSVTSLAPPRKAKYDEAVTFNAIFKKGLASPTVSQSAVQQRQDLIRPVPFSKLCAPKETAPITKAQPIILNTEGVSVSPPKKQQSLLIKKIVVTSSATSTTSTQQQPVLLNHLFGNTGGVLPKIPVLSLATTHKTSVVTPSPLSPKRQIVLRDIPLKTTEKSQPRKSPKAYSALLSLKKNRQLFKCPEFYCSFSTDLNIDLTKHMTSTHGFSDQALLTCLYCDYKVSCETFAIHVEVKHGHCGYGCDYCLYRTTSVYFVHIHQELQHPQLPLKVITIPVFPSSMKAISSDATPPLRKTVLPYICGNWGCKFKTLFTFDFINHLTIHAGGSLCCGICSTHVGNSTALVAHWTTHKVYPFQCRYCLYGNKATYGIGRHQAFCHYISEYSVTCRIFVPDSTNRTPSDYNYDEDEVYQRLLKLPEDANTAEGKKLLDTYKNLPKPPPSASALPEKPDENKEIELVQVPTDNESAAEVDEPIAAASCDDVDPLSLDAATLETLQKEMEKSEEQLPSGGEAENSDSLDEESVGHEELSGKDLFKCKCSDTFVSSVRLRTHIIQCQKEKPFSCAHCTRIFKTITGLLQHYRDHGRARFKCSLCQFKRRHQVAVRNHMKFVHNVGNVMLLPVIAKKVDIDNDDFVLRPRQGGRKSTDGPPGPITKPSVEETSQTEPKLIFGPNEIELLPRPPIYQFDVKCATCAYATKVKSNMVRHLQFHQTEQEVPVIAPVNPVPCLERSERMFDKMVNLASSSHAGGRMGGTKNEKLDKNSKEENVNIPDFVPVSKRFVCGAENCSYLCPEEAMLRRHLTAFHSDDGIYTCHHCNIKISEEKTLNIESVMKHTKLHDHNLYQCGHCKMIHHLRHKMDRHLSEKHFDKAPNLIVIREKVKTPESDPSSLLEKELSKEPKPWRCGMCKYRCTTFNEIKAHASNKHNVDAKYKCALCSHKGELKDGFPEHFDKNHPGHQPDVIVCYYKDDEIEKPKPPPPAENEVEFNTTPIWQRNKQVKHIRGILLDESNSGGGSGGSVVKAPKTPGPKSKLKSPKWAKKDDDEEGGGGAAAASTPKIIVASSKKPSGGLPEARSQKTFKIVKRALKTTKGGKVIKLSGYKFSPVGTKKNANDESSESEIVDIISCDDVVVVPPQDNSESTVAASANTEESSPTTASLKLVNIQTLLEDPRGTEMPGFISISKVIRKQCTAEDSGGGGGDLETIEILDDDGGDNSGKKRKIDLTLREICKMSKEELLAGNYMGTYGPYGAPWDGKYKCPLCEKMTCRTEKELTVHLYRELQYGAFKCAACGGMDHSEEAIRKHYVQMHGEIKSDDVVQTGWDKQIEAWIHKVIAFQGRIMKLEKSEKAPKGEGAESPAAASSEKTCVSTTDASSTVEVVEEDSDSKSKTLYCTFCDYRCKYSSDRRKHELRHWSTKPFSCGYCPYEAVYKSLMLKHLHRIHKDSEPLMQERDLGEGVVIKPIKLNKRKRLLEDPGDPTDEGKEPLEELQVHAASGCLQCYHCDYVGGFYEQLAHREERHSNLPLKLYSYKCNYCKMVFVTLVSMNAHFSTAHPGLEQSFTSVESLMDRRFRCATCLYTSDDYSTVKYHVRSHFKPFQCIYCSRRFSYWNEIQKHHIEMHQSSVYEYKYILKVEKDVWREMEAIQVKKGATYEVFTEMKPFSTKRRRYAKKLGGNNSVEEDEPDEDDDVMIIDDEQVPQVKKPPVVKTTARKSTSVGLPKPAEGFSYYGTKPDEADVKDIITTVEIMGASVTMYVEQLSKIFNLFPSVLVEDCGQL